jgi:hypothetical protein
MLRDSEYINLVKTCIKDTISEYYSNGDVDDIINVELSCNDQNFFEILKMKIRSISIEYSIKKSKQEKETTRILENDIQNLENEMNLRPRDCTQILLNQKKTELEIKRQHIIDGLLLRSLANWHENGENVLNIFVNYKKNPLSTRLFLNL